MEKAIKDVKSKMYLQIIQILRQRGIQTVLQINIKVIQTRHMDRQTGGLEKIQTQTNLSVIEHTERVNKGRIQKIRRKKVIKE